MLAILLFFLISLLLAWPLGLFLAHVMRGGPSPVDKVVLPIERTIYRLSRVDADRGMTWWGYSRAFLASNAALGGLVYLILMWQHRLPLNHDAIGPLRWDLALHTMVSFLVNCNQQHYSGQAQLSYLSQMSLICLQVVTPMMSLGFVAAMLRGLVGGRNAATAKPGEPRDLGNFWADTTRATVRVFLPLCLVGALALTWQGVPSTFLGARSVTPLDPSAGMAEQVIPVGPVAALVASKQLGTNGGGYYGPNSSMPLENPTPLADLIQTIAIVLLPMAAVFMAGPLIGRRRLTPLILGVMLLLSLPLTGLIVWAERAPNAAAAGLAAPGPNLEGKEIRHGADLSAVWGALTTQTSNGSVNAMHDSLQPLGVLATLLGMLVNATWGGVGCGLIGFLAYLLVAVFLAGLMTGRTPELWGRKLETHEIRLLSALVVLQPLTILAGTALMLDPSRNGMSNPGYHGLSQVFYEISSAFANNGSGLEGLGDGTPWWNLVCTVVLLLGRYLPHILPLAVAGSLATKRVAPQSLGSLEVETPSFALTMVAAIILLAVLSFLPVLILGPIAEALSLSAAG